MDRSKVVNPYFIHVIVFSCIFCLGAKTYDFRQSTDGIREVDLRKRVGRSETRIYSRLLQNGSKASREKLLLLCGRKRNNNSFFIDSLNIYFSQQENTVKMASINLYFEHPHRKLLTLASNDATGLETNPRSDDAGNWTGCSINSGLLVGTHRDVSACLLSDHLGRNATVYDLRALTKQDVVELFRKYFWDKLGADSLPNQNVANIATHTFAHAGNVRLIQKALNSLGENLTVDGVSGPMTRAALLRQTQRHGNKLYNRIRQEMEQSYLNAGPVYAGPFITQLNQFWPVLPESGNNVVGAVIALGLAAAAYYYLS